MEELTAVCEAQNKELAGQLDRSCKQWHYEASIQCHSLHIWLCSQRSYHYLLEAESQISGANTSRAQALQLWDR